MADLTSRRDHWTDALPQSWQQSINTSPLLNALGRALQRPSPDLTRGIDYDQHGSVSDRNWLLEQAAGGPPKLNPLAADMIDKGNLLAMFLGPGAKIANRPALARAQQKTAAGVPREQIWNEEGWFQGPDGKWRFEVDDNPLRLNPSREADVPDPKGPRLAQRLAALRPFEMVGSGLNNKAESILLHEALSGAYPHAADTLAVGYSRRPPLPGSPAYYNPARNEIELSLYGGNPRSAAAHELQHFVQKQEGFAPGVDGRRVNQDQYRRSAGEVEARAVQSRLPLTEQERRARPPWLDYDVPESMQIVRER